MPSQIILEGEITLQNLDRLLKELQSALQDQGGVSFSCNNLVYLDTAAFQLLVSFKKSLKTRSLVFQDVPPEVIKMGDLLGLTPFLKLGG
jgi:ABC-type transporter Mla MlaB component